jgi:fatty-acyl-CoA synthase
VRDTLGAELHHSLRRYAARVAVVDDRGVRLTYAELDRWSVAVAAQLAGLGIGAGDAVGIYLHNRAEFVVVDVAVARLGAVKVPVNPLLPPSTVEHVVRASGVRVLVTSSRLTAPTGVAVVDVDAGLAAPGHAVAEPASTAGPDDTAAIYFTGGTTGLPKGVVHSQRSTVAVLYAQLLEAEITQDEHLLLMTPLAHAAGLFALSALVRGAAVTIVDGFDAASALERVERDAVTWTFLVPTMIYRLLDVAGPGRRHGLRTVVYGAAPISPTRLADALAVFGPVFVQLYGQTECPNWGTKLAKSDHDPARPHLLGSCGQASIWADVMVDPDGEVLLRSPYLLDRYLDAPEATAAKFTDDGWIRTGDIGMLDDAGYLYLLDRKADMVVSGGMNVYCKEVEDALGRHPSVSRVAVIGVPHDDWGEAVHAVVVPAAGFSAPDLLEWARGELAGYARPKSVEVVDDLPETPFGKIDKKRLREPHWKGRSRGIA